MNTQVKKCHAILVLLLTCGILLGADQPAAPEITYEIKRESISPDGQFGIEVSARTDQEGGYPSTSYSLRLVRVADRKVVWEPVPDEKHDKLPVAELFAYFLKKSGGSLPPLAWSPDSQRLALAPSTRIWSHLAVLTRNGDIFAREPAELEPDTEKLSSQQLFPQLLKGLANPNEQSQMTRFYVDQLSFTVPDGLDVTASGVFNIQPDNSQDWISYHYSAKLRFSLSTSEEPQTQVLSVKSEKQD